MSRSALANGAGAASELPPATPHSENATNLPPEDQGGAERRAHRRLGLADIPSVTRIRLKYGPAVTLIDLSNGGAQIETTNFRMQPGATVVLELTAAPGDVSIPANVLRCQLARLLPEPVYRAALVFKREFDLRTLGVDHETLEPEDPELDVECELERLRTVVERLQLPASGQPGATAAESIQQALSNASGTLTTPAGKRAGEALREELAEMFHAVASALERTPTPKALTAAIEEHFSHVVPARSVRIINPDTWVQQPGAEAIMLTVPKLASDAPPVRLAVEFGDGSEPQELHMQVLKAGIQLIAIARELGRLNGDDTPLGLKAAIVLPAGWGRVVVRYNSGQVHKGYTTDFQPARGYLQVSPTPVDTPNSRVMVPFTDTKAIFFVKDLTGNKAYQESKSHSPAASAPGRRVLVTFADGEQLAGTALDYSNQAAGYFVEPADPKSNNDRVFVIAQSVKELTFL